jgi:hypothetical protein
MTDVIAKRLATASLKRKRIEGDLKEARREEQNLVAHMHKSIAVDKMKAALDRAERVKALSTESDAVLAAAAAHLPREMLEHIAAAHEIAYGAEREEHDDAAVVVVRTTSVKGKTALAVFARERVGGERTTTMHAFNETKIPASASRGRARSADGQAIQFDASLLEFPGPRDAGMEVFRVHGKAARVEYRGAASYRMLHGFDSPFREFLRLFSLSTV